jgi:hypothetical protein
MTPLRALVAAEPAVQHEIVPLSGPVLRMPGNTFALETGSFECALLGDVVHVGAGFEPLDKGVLEEVRRERCLRRGADPTAAELRAQHDSDVQSAGRRGRPMPHREPANGPRNRPLVILDDERSVVVVDHPVPGKGQLQTIVGDDAEEPERVVRRTARPQQLQIVEPDRTQMYIAHTDKANRSY